MKQKVDFDFSVGSIHDSNNSGKFMIMEDTGVMNRHRVYKIKFIDTGYETTVYGVNIRHGEVKDPYCRNILGVACMGVINDPYDVYKRDYNRWSCMINRCYNPNHSRYPLYGAQGVTVCDRWLCFENYYNDMALIPGRREYLQDPDNWQLDKDITQQDLPKDQMVYSPETCLFVPKRLNITCISRPDYPNHLYGVRECSSNFLAQIKHDGKERTIGSYNTPELAAGAYNCFVGYFYPYMPLNDVRTLTAEELVNLDKRKNRKEMVTIVTKND